MHVDATRLPVMDLTTNHSWVGVRLHLKASYTVPVDVTALKITLGRNRGGQNSWFKNTQP